MQYRPSPAVPAISSLVFLAAFAGCADLDNSGDGDDSGEGDVKFYVKDAPADELRAVFVTFNEVKVHRAGEDDSTDEALQSVPDDDLSTVPDNDIDGDDSSWVTIVNTTKTIDLKQFQGDARAFLGESNVKAGKYTQIRIYVTDSYGEDLEGGRVNVTLSSGVLKIVRPWNVEDGKTTTLVVDFDLDKSLSKQGEDYRLKPVLKLTVENGNADASDATDSTQTSEADEEGNGRDENKTKPSNTHKP